MSNRLQQINETLRHEIGLILLELAEKEWGIYTITDVQSSPDLKLARIWIDADQKTIDNISSHEHSIHQMLRPRITFKFIPKLKFIKDDESVNRVEEILENIK
jgi:ribosome-binding factor A